MLRALFSRLMGGRPSPAPAKSVSEIDTGRLDAVAPERVAAPAEQGAQSAQSFLCREVVLDGDQGVAGYEFQLRRSAGGRLLAQSRRVQHLQNEVLVRNLVQHAVHKMLGQRVTFVPVIDSFAASPVLRQMPPHGVVIVLQQGPREKSDGTELLDQVRELRQAGFCVALEECFDAPYFGQLAPTVDYFVVDVAARNPVSLRMLMAGLAKINPEATTVAKGVSGPEDFEVVRKLGFKRFQGPFVTRREDWKANTLAPDGLRVCELLNRLRRDADTEDLANIIRLDPLLSFRMLRYLNSAAFGLQKKSASVKDALLMMGRSQLHRWLTLLLFHTGKSREGASALMETALLRGRFMELAGRGLASPALREGLFVTGLFSMLDLVLKVPLAEVLRQVQLAEEIPAALLRNEGIYAPYVELALASESFDQERIAAAAAACGLDAEAVNRCQAEALHWAQQVETYPGNHAAGAAPTRGS